MIQIQEQYSVKSFDNHRMPHAAVDLGQTQVNSVDLHFQIWGRDIRLIFTLYHLDHSGSLANFSIAPSDSNGLLSLPFGSVKNGDRRSIAQELVVSSRYGEVFGLSELQNSAVFGGRTIAKAFIDCVSAIIENIRRSIALNLSEQVRDNFTAEIDKRYGQSTREIVKHILPTIHWDLMLAGSGCDDQCLNVVKASFQNNFPIQYEITRTEPTGIPELPQPIYYDARALSDVKATALLEIVCGKKIATFFKKHGYIQAKTQGYEFTIRPGRWIQCTDPAGLSAELCIHTVNFSCNAIDEVVISYLHIHNDLSNWMKSGAIHNAQHGFNAKCAA